MTQEEFDNLQPGDRVRLKDVLFGSNWNTLNYAGQIVTINKKASWGSCEIIEDNGEHIWSILNIEYKVTLLEEVIIEIEKEIGI